MKTREPITVNENWILIQDQEGFAQVQSGKVYFALTDNNTTPTLTSGIYKKGGEEIQVPANHQLYAKTTFDGFESIVTPTY